MKHLPVIFPSLPVPAMSLRTAYPTLFRLPELFARLIAWLSPFRWWTWRLTRRLTLATIVLLTLLGVVYTVENWRGRRAFAAVAREAADQGLSFTLRDHAPSPVPDALNLAKYPLLNHSLDIRDDPYWGNLGNRFEVASGENATPSSHPASGTPSVYENKPADLVTLRADWRKLVTESSAESFDNYLGRLAPMLEELSAAAAARPHLRYDYEWEKLYAITLPHLGALRKMARAASLQALVDVENGRPAEAARALSFPLRVRSALQPEPILITQLVAAAIGGLAYSHLWQGQLRHHWTDAELSLFADLLDDDRILAGCRRSFYAEAAANVSFTLQLADSSSKVPEDIETITDLPRIVRYLRYAPSGWLYQNAAFLGRFSLREAIPSIDLAAAQVHPEKIVFPQSTPTDLSMPYQAIARLTTPALQKVVSTIGQAKTSHDLARLAVGLERHYLAHRVYPESLAPVRAADPALAALHDPFSGEPYHYRRNADGGFTLWGTGRNTRDDGGAYPTAAPDAKSDYATGDLVWNVPGI